MFSCLYAPKLNLISSPVNTCMMDVRWISQPLGLRSNRALLACTPTCNPHNILHALRHSQSLSSSIPVSHIIRCARTTPSLSLYQQSGTLSFSSRTWRTNVITTLQMFLRGGVALLKPPNGCNEANHLASLRNSFFVHKL